MQGTDEQNTEGTCEKCNKTVQGSRRWIINARCVDASGNTLVSFFDEMGCVLLGGKTADELAPLKLDDSESNAFDSYVNSCSFSSYQMRCRIQSEMYQDESRLKTSCLKLDPTDWLSEGRTLLQEIAAMR